MARRHAFLYAGGLVLIVTSVLRLCNYPEIVLLRKSLATGSFALRKASSSGYLSPSESIAACLMMKDDNELLYEWLAYHYVMMPLRYVVIGKDTGSRQDPLDVLRRWKGTGLEYSILHDTDFVERHGTMKRDPKDLKPHHHEFVFRQRGFITVCAEHMKQRNMSWVMYTDSDEFIVINRIGKDDDAIGDLNMNPNDTTASVKYKMRKVLSEWDPPGHTILDAINKMEKEVEKLEPCLHIPRYRFGATETVACEDDKEVVAEAKKNYRFSEMSTLRYHSYAGHFDFVASKYGKVLVDISRFSNTSLAVRPKSIHRPFHPECPYPIIWFHQAVFSIHHYTASWERYSSRHDLRRTCSNWLTMAYYNHSNSCEQQIHKWFPRFTEQFGTRKAQYLLGVDAFNSSQPAEPCPPLTLAPSIQPE